MLVRRRREPWGCRSRSSLVTPQICTGLQQIYGDNAKPPQVFGAVASNRRRGQTALRGEGAVIITGRDEEWFS
ncbi:hypothetical protein GCM10010530_07160 [Kribbella aluminosa]